MKETYIGKIEAVFEIGGWKSLGIGFLPEKEIHFIKMGDWVKLIRPDLPDLEVAIDWLGLEVFDTASRKTTCFVASGLKKETCSCR